MKIAYNRHIQSFLSWKIANAPKESAKLTKSCIALHWLLCNTSICRPEARSPRNGSRGTAIGERKHNRNARWERRRELGLQALETEARRSNSYTIVVYCIHLKCSFGLFQILIFSIIVWLLRWTDFCTYSIVFLFIKKYYTYLFMCIPKNKTHTIIKDLCIWELVIWTRWLVPKFP